MFGLFTVNAAMLKRAIELADAFVVANDEIIPLAVKAQWRMMRPTLMDWREALALQEDGRR
jgi:hypothetical protein